MKHKGIIYLLAGIVAAVICAFLLAVVRAETPSPSVWVHMELYDEGRSEYQKKHYEKALKYLVDFRDENKDLLDSTTLSRSQIEFRDNLNDAITDCESKKRNKQTPWPPRAAPSAAVHNREASES